MILSKTGGKQDAVRQGDLNFNGEKYEISRNAQGLGNHPGER
jgi:hypothetical protein